MRIMSAGSRPTTLGGAGAFSGHVTLDPIIGEDDAGLRANVVTFAPGARTYWHHHDYGQTLFVTHGEGRICLRGEEPKPIRAGDTVWIPAGVEHWHGGAETTTMTHIAMQSSPHGGETHWLDEVTD